MSRYGSRWSDDDYTEVRRWQEERPRRTRELTPLEEELKHMPIATPDQIKLANRLVTHGFSHQRALELAYYHTSAVIDALRGPPTFAYRPYSDYQSRFRDW